MKEYNIYIDISEIISVKANNKEEAIKKAEEELGNTSWSVDDAELQAEEIK